jgi:hypothetical protein
MRIWSKDLIVKIVTILTVFSICMSVAFFFVYFFSEGINIKSLKALVSFIAISILFISLLSYCWQTTKKNYWLALIAGLLLAFPLLSVVANFIFDGFFVYDSWKLLSISFITGSILTLLISIGFLSGKSVRFKWFQQILSFAIIVFGIGSVYYILDSFTSLMYMDTLFIGFSVCIFFLCIHTYFNFSTVEVSE